MSRGSTWMNAVTPNQLPDVQMLAVDTARTIAQRPTTIVITRDAANNTTVTLPPQTVRVDINQNVRAANELRDTQVMFELTEQYVFVLGYKGHKYIPDTDLKYADRFFYKGRKYEVIEIKDDTPGRLIASAKVKSG